ncbi:MAG: GNAT family N-acetyltransferase [Pirellulaceae bacterium]|nr:GNAT family N-acetyltransferase [Pirellulaceae bacterium]
MLRYRSFRNTDPPRIVEVWRSAAGDTGLFRPVSVDLLEQFVMARLYFEPEGLWLAWDDDRPVGFAHAGFGPDEQQARISHEWGTTCLLLTTPDGPRQEVAGALLELCERYLVSRGAKVLYGGGIRPLNPFYLGIFGGSELPGVPESDTIACETFAMHNYREIDRTITFHCDLHRFEPPTSREQMQIRRRMTVNVVADSPARDWWEACTMGSFDLTRYELCPRAGGPSVAHALLRNMDPTNAFGGGRAVGLIELEVDPRHRRQGLVTYLLSEVFHQLSRQGIVKVEVQTMQNNKAARALYRRLGFQEVGQGIVFRKEENGE